MHQPSRASNPRGTVLVLGVLIACAALPADATEHNLSASTDGYVKHGTTAPTDCSVAELVNTTATTMKVTRDKAFTDLRGRAWSVITFGPIPSGTITSASLKFFVKTSVGLNVEQARVAISYQVIGSGPGSVAATDQPDCSSWISGSSVDINEPTFYTVPLSPSWIPAGGWIRFLLSDSSIFDTSEDGEQTTTICGMEGGDVDKGPRLQLVN